MPVRTTSTMWLIKAVIGFVLLSSNIAQAYLVGVGTADSTGPASDVCFMGYANPAQIAAGIHFRLRARAMVIGDDANKDRFVYVSIDSGMGSQSITREVIHRLQRRFPGQYSQRNVFISGTHTHAAPGGFSQYLIHQIGSDGFVPETFEAYVRGIVDAITRAHLSALPHSKIYFGMGRALPKSNINRSPSAYRANPQSERDAYEQDGGDTDKIFTLLKLVRPDGTPTGMFNWFSVHGTSMPSDNTLISGDNKGYASQLFEAAINGPNILPGQGSFVAAFAATNLGDVSPNVNGTFCQKSGLPCEELHSTCKGLSEFCHGLGPGKDVFESTKIIGERQAKAALDAFQSLNNQVDDSGSVWSVHRIVDFSNVTVDLQRIGQVLFPSPKTIPETLDIEFATAQTQRRRTEPDQESLRGGSKEWTVSPPEWTKMGTVTTCKSALGYSFAAGTTDGPGIFDFYQGEKRGKPFWEFVRDFIAVPSNESARCHFPKPILLPTGEINFPYTWEPHVMSIGLSVIGKSFAILSVPSEFSTMAGRRLKRVVKAALVQAGKMNPNGIVALSCLTNAYSHYVVTYEEYTVQRYEGASTLFGPHTLAAYIQEFLELIKGGASTLKDDDKIPNLMNKALTFLSETNVDRTEHSLKFGDVVREPKVIHSPGDEVVVEFLSANLRHDPRLGDTFLTVERMDSTEGVWVVVKTDASFDTKLHYSRKKDISKVRVEWHIPSDASPGTYRVGHRAAYKASPNARLIQFSGYSRPFRVVA